MTNRNNTVYQNYHQLCDALDAAHAAHQDYQQLEARLRQSYDKEMQRLQERFTQHDPNPREAPQTTGQQVYRSQDRLQQLQRRFGKTSGKYKKFDPQAQADMPLPTNIQAVAREADSQVAYTAFEDATQDFNQSEKQLNTLLHQHSSLLASQQETASELWKLVWGIPLGVIYQVVMVLVLLILIPLVFGGGTFIAEANLLLMSAVIGGVASVASLSQEDSDVGIPINTLALYIPLFFILTGQGGVDVLSALLMLGFHALSVLALFYVSDNTVQTENAGCLIVFVFAGFIALPFVFLEQVLIESPRQKLAMMLSPKFHDDRWKGVRGSLVAVPIIVVAMGTGFWLYTNLLEPYAAAENLESAFGPPRTINFALFPGSPQLQPPLQWVPDTARGTSYYQVSSTDQSILLLHAAAETGLYGDVTTAPLLTYDIEGDFIADISVDVTDAETQGGRTVGFGIRSAENPNAWSRIQYDLKAQTLSLATNPFYSLARTTDYDNQMVQLRIVRRDSEVEFFFRENGDDYWRSRGVSDRIHSDPVQLYITNYAWEDETSDVYFSNFTIYPANN
jgi:hypothetical protein